MSDDGPRVDCDEALDRLYEYLDGELTPAVEAAVRRHLTACAPCLRIYDFERAFLRFLDARAQAAEAPPELRRRVLERLLFDETQLHGE
jgi:anti-sigma factor (TIGR02949 family)